MIAAWMKKTIPWMARLGLLALMLLAMPVQAAGSRQPEGPEQPGDPELVDGGDAPAVTDDVIFSETGDNDFRISFAGPNANTNYRSVYPAVAYNSASRRYLAVWWGDDNNGGVVMNEYEIFAQQINADTGQVIGGNMRISFMGIDGNVSYSALNPDIVYNPTDDEYFVVWEGEATINRYEIWGQRLDGGTVAPIGPVIRISSMGAPGNIDYDGYTASVAWNSTDNEYLVVWSGDSLTHGVVNEEFEIFGQRIEANTGNLIGANFLISEMGPDNNAAYDAISPDVAYSPVGNEYWVVWAADDNTDGVVDDENEIYFQRLNASDGTQISFDDRRVSTMGQAGNPAYDAAAPQVACNTVRNDCLITWSGDHNAAGQVDNETEIFMQRVSGPNPTTLNMFGQYRISLMNGLGDAAYGGYLPQVTYNPQADEYLVAWYGKGMVRTYLQTEVFVQRISGLGQKVGEEIAVSDMGPDSVDTLTAQSAALTYNPDRFEYLVVWHGDDTVFLLINDEIEIFGQRLTGGDYFEVMLPLVTRE